MIADLVVAVAVIAVAGAIIIIASGFVVRDCARHGPRRYHVGLDLPDDPGVPDDPDELLSVLRPQGTAVATKMHRVLHRRRALLRKPREGTRS
jgi:hypothetical protein